MYCLCTHRTNLSFASVQLNADLGFDERTYGLGAGLFFASCKSTACRCRGVWAGSADIAGVCAASGCFSHHECGSVQGAGRCAGAAQQLMGRASLCSSSLRCCGRVCCLRCRCLDAGASQHDDDKSRGPCLAGQHRHSMGHSGGVFLPHEQCRFLHGERTWVTDSAVAQWWRSSRTSCHPHASVAVHMDRQLSGWQLQHRLAATRSVLGQQLQQSHIGHWMPQYTHREQGDVYCNCLRCV